jgi:hypothetical protein
MSTIPPGADEKYLIEPSYVSARHWGLYGFGDRLTLRQIKILLGSGPSRNVYGAFKTLSERKSIRLKQSAEAMSNFFAEMVGGDVCVFDLPNSFLVSVFEGDITLVATYVANLENMFGVSSMSRSDWIELTKNLRCDVTAKLLSKYT